MPEPAPSRAVARDIDELPPEPPEPPTQSPAWSLLRGHTEIPEEVRAAFVPEPTRDPQPPKRRGLLARLFGRRR